MWTRDATTKANFCGPPNPDRSSTPTLDSREPCALRRKPRNTLISQLLYNKPIGVLWLDIQNVAYHSLTSLGISTSPCPL